MFWWVPWIIYIPPLALLWCTQYHVMLGYDIEYACIIDCWSMMFDGRHKANIRTRVIWLQTDVLRHHCWQGYDINVLHIEPQIFDVVTVHGYAGCQMYLMMLKRRRNTPFHTGFLIRARFVLFLLLWYTCCIFLKHIDYSKSWCVFFPSVHKLYILINCNFHHWYKRCTNYD